MAGPIDDVLSGKAVANSLALSRASPDTYWFSLHRFLLIPLGGGAGDTRESGKKETLPDSFQQIERWRLVDFPNSKLTSLNEISSVYCIVEEPRCEWNDLTHGKHQNKIQNTKNSTKISFFDKFD
jgi:hypothetical protein